MTSREVLGVSEDATLEEITRAWRREARKYHPDHNKTLDAADRFNTARLAYEELKKGPILVSSEQSNSSTWRKKERTPDSDRWRKPNKNPDPSAWRRKGKSNTTKVLVRLDGMKDHDMSVTSRYRPIDHSRHVKFLAEGEEFEYLIPSGSVFPFEVTIERGKRIYLVKFTS